MIEYKNQNSELLCWFLFYAEIRGIYMKKDLSYLIEVVKLDSFWNANYYLRSMKKAPHGGIEYVTILNFYLRYRPTGPWALFVKWNGTIPAFIHNLMDDEEIWWYTEKN